MIVHKNPISIEIGAIIPEDRIGYEDVFEVNENTDLGKKIVEYVPYFEFVLDHNGELLDITPTERPPISEQKPTDLEILGQLLSEREIQEIIQGQQISDLEIRLLMGGL